MINQFRNLNPINIFLLIIIAFVLNAGVLYHLPSAIGFEVSEPVRRFFDVEPVIHFFTPLQNVLLACIVVIIQALLFNRLVNGFNLLGKPTFLPALLYITGSSLFVPFLVLSPALICNFFLIWIINRFLGVYKQGNALSIMFDAGMVIAMGTLVYFPFITMLLALWLCLVVFRPFSWREWVAGIIGFVTVFFFIAVYYFWNDSLSQFFNIFLPLTSRFPAELNINIYDYLILVPVIIILILSVIHLRQKFFRSFVQVRKSFQLLFLMFLIALMSFYLNRDYPLYHFLLAVPMGAVFMAYYFLHATVKWFYESLYLILFGAIIYFQFI